MRAKKDGPSKTDLHWHCPRIRFAQLPAVTFPCQYLGHSRTAAIEQQFRIRTRPADLAAGRSAWGTFQLHQQPVFSWQAGLCESRLSFDARCNDIARFSLSPETVITLDDLLEMSAVSIDPGDARYRQPLCQDARALAGVLRLVPRSCYSAASLAASTSIRCLKLILPLL